MAEGHDDTAGWVDVVGVDLVATVGRLRGSSGTEVLVEV